MRWTEEHDKLPVREILLFEPWNHRYASKERGQSWERISEALNNIAFISFKVKLK